MHYNWSWPHSNCKSVHAFCRENYPTKPCIMHECLGMDWYQERNEGVYLCIVIAPHNNCSTLNFNHYLESVYYSNALMHYSISTEKIRSAIVLDLLACKCNI